MSTIKKATTVVESNVESTGISKEQFLQYTKNRQFLPSANKYAVKVRSVNQWVNPSGQTVAILNLDAITPYHMEQIKQFIASGELQEASNCVLTASVRVGIDYVPSKGELINIELVEGVTKAGDNALFVQGVTPRPVAASASVNFAAMFE